MTVGEALAEARHRAGLTVDELSERTRIRETVIRCIEQDDYGACGGDIYVRGYVRAIAGAVGIDAQPLIRDYDAERAGAPAGTPATAAGTPATAAGAAATAAGAASAFARVLADSTVATMPQPVAQPEPRLSVTKPEPALPVTQPEPVTEPEPPTVIDLPPIASEQGFATTTTAAPPAVATAATPAPSVTSAPRATAAPSAAIAPPVESLQPSAWRARIRGRRWVTGIAILVVAALAVAGFAGSRIVSHLRQHTPPGSASAAQQQAVPGAKAGTAGTKGSGANAGQAAATPRSHRNPRKHTTPTAPRALPVHWLPIRAAIAFGPDGAADGDNPQTAAFAISGGSPSPWQTDWYASPAFGLLKNGTGLLLDMGTMVTVTSMRIDLSPYKGADVQIRLGDTASDLRVAAHADDAGGTVRLDLRSAPRARYVLIWFTLLPPDGAGTYQESVYRVVVNGRR